MDVCKIHKSEKIFKNSTNEKSNSTVQHQEADVNNSQEHAFVMSWVLIKKNAARMFSSQLY